MKVSVNDKPVEVPKRDGRSLEDLLDDLRHRGEIGDDQVVVGLEVDRRPWRTEGPHALGDAGLDDVNEVAISTTGMRGYARRILADAGGALAVLKEATQQVARSLRQEEPSKANADLFNLLDALQHLLACVYHVQNSCALHNGPAGTSSQLLERLNDGLDAIQARQQRQQWDGVASELEGRFLPALQELESVIENMKGEL